LLSLLLACQYGPFADRYTTTEPTQEGIVGVYTLQECTLIHCDLADLHGRICSLELKSDGTFIGKGIPPRSMSSPQEGFLDTLLDVTGTWKVGFVGDVDNGFKSTWVYGLHLESQGGIVAWPHLMGNEPPYDILFSLSDPDEQQALIFKKAR